MLIGDLLRLTIALCLVSLPLAAQWPQRPTPGLPRTADGKPNLAATPGRTADGKPDLTGVWMVSNGSFYLNPGLKPEDMQPWAAALYKQRQENYRRDTDGIRCLPPGPKAGIGLGNFPMKIVQTPGLIVILYEYQTVFRQIFTDGRGLPEDPNPTWMGYSVGHWEGDTLVVSTGGYNDRTSLDLAGHPHTESLRMTERYHRRDGGHLDVQVTFEDPKAYHKPWNLPMEYSLVADGELIEYVCENERDSKHLVGQSGEEAPVPVEILAQYIGEYDAPARQRAYVTLEGNRLMVAAGKAVKIPLVAHSETSFTMEGTGVDLVKDASGKVTGLIQHWSEGDYNYKRIK
jgi:hypothetical protein